MIKTPDFDKAPFLVIWETTRACGLACRHCRASAVSDRDSLELNTEEAKTLIDSVKEMGTPIMVFSGGDPLMRPDLDELIEHGVQAGLRVGTIPAATPLLTKDRIGKLKNAGLHQMALSLDGHTEEIHDGFRGVPGSFKHTLQAAKWANELEQPLQINSVVTRDNADDFSKLASLVESLGIVFWEVFFLVRMGRGTELQECTPDQQAEVFEQLAEIQKKNAFIVKVTEAPQYRRYLSESHAQVTPLTDGTRPLAVSRAGVNSGKGFCFVDHQGNVFPSGFLPVSGGSLRENSITDIYRNTEIFQKLRDPGELEGRCALCDFCESCGGSRARAFASTGNMFSEDPSCTFEPSESL